MTGSFRLDTVEEQLEEMIEAGELKPTKDTPETHQIKAALAAIKQRHDRKDVH